MEENEETSSPSVYRKHREKMEDIKRQGREERMKRREEQREVYEPENSDEYEWILENLTQMGINTKKPNPCEGTGFVYDGQMAEHKNEWDPEFPEKPERVVTSFKRICELGLIERCHRIEARYGTEDQVLYTFKI